MTESTRIEQVIVIPLARLWFWRVLPLIAAGACLAGIWTILISLAGSTEGPTRSLVLAFLAFNLGLAGAAVFSLGANRFGIYPEGFAPPTKPLRGILKPLWVLPWEDVTDIEVIPRPRSPSNRGGRATVRIVSTTHRTDWLLASHRLPRVFGSVRQGERFLTSLQRIGHEIRQRGRPLTADEVATLLREM
jgi:hypothetical protein